MATSFAPTTSVRSLHSLRSFTSAATASYTTLKLPRGFALPRTPLISKVLSPIRTPLVRGATIEQIEAEKAAIEKDVKNRMERTIDNVRTNFNSIRTGRANPAMLDNIEPYDKSSLKAIEKAMVSSDLDVTPNNDGESIRLSIPQLTSERRKEVSKIVGNKAEEVKVALRNIRRDALKAHDKLEKKLTDGYMKKIETISKQKEKELLTV